MNELIKTGKKRTLLISMSLLLVSIHTIYFYHAARPEVETKKLIQQVIRFVLTIVLLAFVFKGKKWAKTTSIVLFLLAILGAFAALIITEGGSVIDKVPLLVMILVYSVAVYHFGFSNSFKAFFDYQNRIRDEQ